jgi:serine/threonine-protein kinase PknG
MTVVRCQQKGCTGQIQDGYCEVCGHAEPRPLAATSAGTAPTATSGIRPTSAMTTGSAVTTGTGSSPLSRSAKGSRRSSHSSSRSTRKQLGAGLITLPDLPSTDPEKAVLDNPTVPERKRFCPKCDSQLKRESGFCGKCGQRYSFIPTLKHGDVIGGQYEVKGVIAYGGLGWIYLGFDKILNRYVVLKGLLNALDPVSAAAALAERQFLASVKHPNIVGIYNFVQQGAEGFIVMEYVGGQTLKQIRQERGPLPVAEAIAYIHRILPAFSYLHQQGLVYCDFKPDNVMLERDDVKLIDMGGVRRIEDTEGDIYGTVGYSAPEAASGPTVASDLFTIGRTLTVLLTEIKNFTTQHRFTLPSPQEDPLFLQQESLYRALLRSTAEKPDDRFESADEMADQLLGVLREVVSIQTGESKGGVSSFFGPDSLAFESGHELEPIVANYHHLPQPLPDPADPGLQLVSNAGALSNINRRIMALRSVSEKLPKSRLAKLRLATSLAETGNEPEAEKIFETLEKEDPWDWRILWYRGRMRLHQNRPKDALPFFDQVYFDLPGELVPKLALGLSAEMAGNVDLAIKMYDLVSRTDPTLVSACFGLARCLHAKGQRKAAVEALDRVPHTSAVYLRARIEAARTWIRGDSPALGVGELTQASAVAETLTLEGMGRFRLSSMILYTALDLVASRKLKADPAIYILGEPLEERQLRAGLEKSLRAMAQLASGDERIRLVDRANEIRPRTLV